VKNCNGHTFNVFMRQRLYDRDMYKAYIMIEIHKIADAIANLHIAQNRVSGDKKWKDIKQTLDAEFRVPFFPEENAITGTPSSKIWHTRNFELYVDNNSTHTVLVRKMYQAFNFHPLWHKLKRKIIHINFCC